MNLIRFSGNINTWPSETFVHLSRDRHNERVVHEWPITNSFALLLTKSTKRCVHLIEGVLYIDINMYALICKHKIQIFTL